MPQLDCCSSSWTVCLGPPWQCVCQSSSCRNLSTCPQDPGQQVFFFFLKMMISCLTLLCSPSFCTILYFEESWPLLILMLYRSELTILFRLPFWVSEVLVKWKWRRMNSDCSFIFSRWFTHLWILGVLVLWSLQRAWIGWKGYLLRDRSSSDFLEVIHRRILSWSRKWKLLPSDCPVSNIHDYRPILHQLSLEA